MDRSTKGPFEIRSGERLTTLRKAFLMVANCLIGLMEKKDTPTATTTATKTTTTPPVQKSTQFCAPTQIPEVIKNLKGVKIIMIKGMNKGKTGTIRGFSNVELVTKRGSPNAVIAISLDEGGRTTVKFHQLGVSWKLTN